MQLPTGLVVENTNGSVFLHVSYIIMQVRYMHLLPSLAPPDHADHRWYLMSTY